MIDQSGSDVSEVDPNQHRSPCPVPASLRKALSEYQANAEVVDIQTRFYRVRCRILGQGPPVVVSPGLALTYEGFAHFLNTLAE